MNLGNVPCLASAPTVTILAFDGASPLISRREKLMGNLALVARSARALAVGLTLSAAAFPALGGALQSAPRSAAPLGLEERIACQRAIEETHWRHRVWPDSNAGPKPELSSVLSEAALTGKVRDALSKSSALGTLWKRPITAAQLRAEIAHMARNTRNPEMLGELWDALGNDPTLVAECLARPMIADRLIRNWFGFDDRIHGELRERVRSDLHVHRTIQGMRAMSGRYEEQVWRRGDKASGSALDTRKASQGRILGEEEWSAEMARLKELFALDGKRSTGDPDALPVRKVSSIQEDERRFHVLAVLEVSPESLTLATVTWPKRAFDDWWQENASAFPAAPPVESVQVEPLPAIAPPGCTDDTWGATPFSPRGRDMHVMVWTGAELLIWGGDFVEGEKVRGGRYDPATDTYRPIGWINEPTMRQLATAVWTGTEMIVWGGGGGGTSDNMKNTGGRYNPVTDSWTPTSVSGAVPGGRWHHTAVWTGSAMIVWGGCSNLSCFPTLDTGGRYDPGTDSWSAVSRTGAPAVRELHTAVWTGFRMIVWGGENSGAILRDGGRYDPATDTWSELTLTGAPDARSLHSAVWTGSEMIVWGGCRSSACFYPLFDSGGRYDPVADSWRPTRIVGAPYQRRHHTAVWSGQEMIVWGGCVDADCSDVRDSGGRYDPLTDTWAPTDTTTDPGARAMHTAVWTGSEMMVWGGCLGGECAIELTGGGRYSPATDSWVPIGGGSSPLGRIYHTAVWTGSEMIVWGGTSSSPMREGRRYDTATDRWTPVTTIGAPAARGWHSAVWTGTEMIVWGGALPFGQGAGNTGGRYDPTTDSWRPTSTAGAPEARTYHTAVWTGAEMIVWGGLGAAGLNTGGRYDPATDSWTSTSTVGAPSGRFDHSDVWTGSELIVWGGGPDFPWSAPPTATGGRYSPATDSWAATSLSGAPGARRLHTGVWTGSEMIVWGGEGASGFLGDGARYDPTSDAWTPVSLLSAPSPRRDHAAVWTGSKMMIWGGESGVGLHADGGRYDPAGDTWSPTSAAAFVPTARALHTAVWTGTEAIIWGGRGAGYPDTGARYCATGSAGSPPGSVDGLTVAGNVNGTDLDLAWNGSCSGQATDYAVYEGVIGSWYSHVIKQCSTGGAMATTISPDIGDRYYLVVPLGPASEGSYGGTSSGTERPPAASACRAAQDPAPCP
jgi:N-acetylneuraminic acid mutarotase